MNKFKKQYRFDMPLRTSKEKDNVLELAKIMQESSLSDFEKATHFSLFAPRQAISSFLFRYEIFKRILNIQGSILECGVAYGSGLMTFALLSSIFEPVNHTRRIVGFDTFTGFPEISTKDNKKGDPNAKVGGLKIDSFEEIQKCVKVFDQNRFIGHIEKVQLVRGDLIKTAPAYLKNNPHLTVALLYLDLDIYEPTRVALKTFLPRMPKGSIIVFDQLNHPDWPGETLAPEESLGIKNLKIQRFPFDSIRSYAVIGD